MIPIKCATIAQVRSSLLTPEGPDGSTSLIDTYSLYSDCLVYSYIISLHISRMGAAFSQYKAQSLCEILIGEVFPLPPIDIV